MFRRLVVLGLFVMLRQGSGRFKRLCQVRLLKKQYCVMRGSQVGQAAPEGAKKRKNIQGAAAYDQWELNPFPSTYRRTGKCEITYAREGTLAGVESFCLIIGSDTSRAGKVA
jgi:hypothetical protein